MSDLQLTTAEFGKRSGEAVLRSLLQGEEANIGIDSFRGDLNTSRPKFPFQFC